ncbi:MAG: BspA family leucine-rich repeat surface protein [Lachnospiraceae bacterium]|nr:BspA family leucine-rich repeat surface protein [Lachnospiraceae bacterium]
MEENNIQVKKSQKKYLLVLLALVLIAIAVAAVLIAVKVKSRNTWQAQYDLGMQYLDEGDYEAAIVAFTKAIELEPNDIRAYTGLIEAYIGDGNYYLAINAVDQGVLILSGDELEQEQGAIDDFITVLLALGSLYQDEDMYGLSKTVYTYLIEVSPDSVDAYTGRAENEEALDEVEEALEDYRKAKELIEEGEDGTLTEDELDERIAEIEDKIAKEDELLELETDETETIDIVESGENEMKSIEGEGYENLPGNPSISRLSILSITILDSLDGVPEDAWDISTKGDGSVMMWVTETDEVDETAVQYEGITQFYDLFIAGEGGVDAPKDSSRLFSGYVYCKSMDLKYLHTEYVTDMSFMFCCGEEEKNCGSELVYLDISGFDTSNVENMSWMFAGCSLTELDVSHFDTSKVTSMQNMFYNLGVSELDVSGFDTGNVTDMSRMFGCCFNLTELDVSGFDTGNVTDMSGMFDNCYNLSELDVSHFDTGNVKNMQSMFFECENLVDLDVSGFNTSNCTNMAGMFSGCANLSVDVSGFDFSLIDSSVLEQYYGNDYSRYLGLTE